MLVLSRKAFESIIIGDNIEVTVTEISGDKVKIGINAPKDIKIVRSEIRKIEETNKTASESIAPKRLSGFAAALKANKK